MWKSSNQKTKLEVGERVHSGDRLIRVEADHVIVVSDRSGKEGARVLLGVMINNENLQKEGKKVTWQEK